MLPKLEDGSWLPQYVHKPGQSHVQHVLWACMLILEVVIYASYSIFVNLSEEDGRLPYNTASVVLLIELLKFILSAVMYLLDLKSHNYAMPYLPLLYVISYAVPGVLYTINNNIGLIMQLYMDPTTFQVLSNMKIAFTAVLYKVIINRKISRSQWLAVVLLILAGLFHSFEGFHSGARASDLSRIYITFTGLVLITAYCAISGLAAVYTEYILKRQKTTSLHLQNMILYTYGLLFNLSTFLWQRGYTGEGQETAGLFTGFSTYTWLVVVSQAFNGLIMSVIMKHGSNLTRLFIISGAMLMSTVMAMFVFGTVISNFFILAAVLVISAIYLYHR